MSSKESVQVVNTEIVTNRVGNSVRRYIIYTMADGTYLMGELAGMNIQELSERQCDEWLA